MNRDIVIHVLGKEANERFAGTYIITGPEVSTIFSSVEVLQGFCLWCGRTEEGEYSEVFRTIPNATEYSPDRKVQEKILISGIVKRKMVEVTPERVILTIDLINS